VSLDLTTAALLKRMSGEGGPALHELPVEQARTVLKALSDATGIAKADVHSSLDQQIPGPNGEIPIRIYWPRTSTEGGLLPALILYHGGGWILGDIESHDAIARYLCRQGDVVVVSVDYRLAPENKFPAGVEDCYAALEWVAENAAKIGIDARRIALTGDSAGGNLTIVMSLLARARSGPDIAFQIPVYPCVDCRESADYSSRKKFGNGEYFLTSADIAWINGKYFSTADEAKDFRASPIVTKDLSGLPPALLITAGCDPLCDEGALYARRLSAAGVPVEYRCYSGTIHGFLSFAGVLDAGREALDLIADRLRVNFGPRV
jgi:acetyl esterase